MREVNVGYKNKVTQYFDNKITGQKPAKDFANPILIFIAVAILIFLTEVFVMLILSTLPSQAIINEALIDALLQILILCPVLYFLMYKPFRLRIAERRRAEERLKDSEKRSRAWLEHSPACTKIVDLDFNLQYMSAAGINALKIEDITKFYGKPYPLDFYPDSFKKPMTKNLGKVKKTGQIITQEAYVVDIDGNELWFHSTLVPVNDDEGKIDYIIVVSLDITERKRAEQALKRSEEILKKERNNLRSALNLFSSIINEVEKNRGFDDALYKLVENPNIPVCWEMKNCNFKECPVHGLRNVRCWQIAGTHCGGKVQGQFALKFGACEKCEVYKESVKIPKYEITETFNNMMHILEDAQRELKDAKIAAESASRTKSEFLANMSHEIRTPMNGIVGMAELLCNTEPTNDQKEYLDILKTSTDNLLSIINDILDISKIEAGKLEFEHIDFDLRRTITDTFKILSYNADKKGLELLNNISADIPDIMLGDPVRLRQILINLVSNAIKFTEKGEVAVSVDIESRTEDEITLHFFVSDTGIGIPEDKKKHIFDTFTQADSSSTRKYGGTGLGLPISSRLVEMMKGKIWVESEVGKGSAFHFTARLGIASELEKQELPEEDVNSEYESSDNQINYEDRKKIHILLAEDNDISQKWQLLTLERQGYTVEIANNGEEVLEGLKKQHFDIVLMDVQMPKMDGIEAARAIRSSTDNTFNPEIPIIAVTAHALEEEKERCLKAGMNSCVTKPFNSEELFKEIEGLLQTKDIAS